MLALSGHKLHAPKGVGALYVRRGLPFRPFMIGGHQERGRRAGTENVAALAGFGAAAERARHGLADGTAARVADLGERLLDGLLAACPDARLNGERAGRVPAIASLRFPGVDGEALLHELDRQGVAVSTGSACSAAAPGPSHVLTALGLSAADAHASVRFSLGPENDAADIDWIVEATPAALARLRALEAPAGRRTA
jgi:cysteine desulfurase